MKKYIKSFIISIIIIVLVFTTLIMPVLADDDVIINLTDEEKTYIENHPSIDIAMDSSWIPYAFYNSETSEVDGIIPEILNTVASRVGLKVNYINKDTYFDAISTVKDNKSDLVSGIANDQRMADKNDVLITNPYITINYSAITSRKLTNLYSEGATYKVAVCVGSYSTMAMKDKMPSYEFIEYHNNEECMNAVKNDEVDMALIASYAAEFYLNQYEYNDLYTVPINDFSWGLCFGVNKLSDPLLVDILNKGIDSLSDNDVNSSIFNGLSNSDVLNNGFSDWVYTQPVYAIAIAVLIVSFAIIIIFLLILHHNKRKQLEAQKEINEKVISAEKTRTDFYSRMSHDIRTPMNVIINLTELAKQNDNPKDTQDCLNNISESSDFLLGLVNDVLDMSKIESNHIEIHEAPYSSKEFANYFYTIVKPMCNNKDISLEYIYDDQNNFAVYQDKLRINQIFFNLLSNAIKFTPEGGKITFSTYSEIVDDEHIRLISEIKDNGIGMSEEFMQRMYEPFVQEEQSIMPLHSGSGLGLSIVKKLCDLMNIKISCTSKLNEGTTFTIDGVYRIYKGEVKEEIISKDYSVFKDKYILIAEDHPMNQVIIKRMLEKKGFITKVVDNGQECLDAYNNSSINGYSAILMDIRMPLMDGIEACKAIRNSGREDAKTIPIIAMSANAYAEDNRKHLMAGMNDNIPKPINSTFVYDTLLKYIK